jgi:hypothetical protein
MLGINDRCWRTSTTHSDIELVIIIVVAHLGEALDEVLFVCKAIYVPRRWVLGVRAVQTHTLLSGETGPRRLDGWTDPALIAIADKASKISCLLKNAKVTDNL